MCGSMIDIQSAMAKITRGKKRKKKKEKPQGKNIMSASATQGGHNEDGLRQLTDLFLNYSHQR